ncbi:MAG: phosphate signaling complex protein PhoU [Pseudomonadales bacterium]|nr:phosphate signaling complex protein PhoU [Pseudomonadales bacterium]
MSLHLQRDLDQLKKEILQLGSMVETAINNAILALNDRRPELAENVFSEEILIDEKEVLIEEDCLKILALHQPVAVDLRFIVVVLKVNNDLERMGDFAVNVAKRAVFLSSQNPIPYPPEFTDKMSKSIRTMVHNSLDALVKLDVDLARNVIAMDDVVDDVNRQMYVELQALMENDSSTIERAIGLLSTSRYLERIADLATNIAEDVIFMVEGEVVRHQTGC